MNFLFQHTPFKFFFQSLWRDEAFSYLLSQHNIFQIVALTAKDFTPPLYYILLHIWMGLFGSSEVSMRSISLLFFVATAYYVFDILTEICQISVKRSFLYLSLIFLNPLLNYYAFEARPYAMVAFFATASAYAFFVKKRKLYFFMTLLGMYTHYFMLFVVISQGLFVLIKHRNVKYILDELKRIATPVLLWLPWMLYMISQRSVTNQEFWIKRPISQDILYLLGTMYTGYEKSLGWDVVKMSNGYTYLMMNISIFLTVLFIIGSAYIFLKNKRSKTVALYFGLWGLLAPITVLIISFFFTPLYLPRYLIIAAPGLLIYFIYLIDALPFRARVLTLLVLFILTVQYTRFNVIYRSKTTVSKMYTEIKAVANKDDVIYVRDVLDFHLAQYYFDKDRVFIYGEAYDEIPSYVGKVLIPEDKIMKFYPIHPKRAFVVTDNTQEYYVRSQY